MIQSVLFDKHKWSQERARRYLKRKGLKDNGVDETENQLRYRQLEPDSNKRYYTKTLTGGVQYLIYF